MMDAPDTSQVVQHKNVKSRFVLHSQTLGTFQQAGQESNMLSLRSLLAEMPHDLATRFRSD